ncbi:phage antirepressor N-terminal domain-containing protein [Providencia stuartii]|uniref:phage antirepressor N-terminal domain-containing protein n=1 Tax=Providencia stuartii TaxID=588 RepID=UPI0028820CA8|nr:phage antirepressor N-terminal domain-containing protein [Providencia stuartii]MDK7737622.1 phage antirepressor N-terminal domain-containing protein [Providencia stuartii]HEM8344524.1 phage antirepressor N-terminal domain-containing protein [Providencia stuartii]
MSTISTINVPFHGANLCIVNHDGNPYVPMKPIIEGMGLDWASQFTKLKKRFSKGIVEIAIPSKGGEQSMICLAMHKLTGWLYSIMPNKVKPEIRDRVIQYQEECDDVLYEYWTTGEVKAKPRKQAKQIAGRITSEQQEAIKQLVLNRGKALPKDKQAKAMITMWSSLKSHFGCTYKEIDSDKFTEALSLVARVPLEGEYIPKDDPRETTHLYVNRDRDIHNINALAKHYEAIYTAWKVEIYPALRSIDSPVAPRLYDRFKDGYSFLRMLQESLNGKHPVLIK